MLAKPLSRVAAGLLVALGSLLYVLSPSLSYAATEVPTFTFKGSGYGHGLGLSQYGALEAAKKGLTADQIIKHYFTGVTIESRTTKRALVHLDAGKKARSSWTLRPGYAGSYLTVDGVQYPDNSYKFTLRDGKILMSWSESGTPKSVTLGTTVTVKPESVSGANLTQVVDRSGPLNSAGGGYADVRYRGYMVLNATASGVELINSLDIEGYLYGVVPRELGDAFSPLPAASQAQAIAARSYAYPKVNAGTKMACTTSDQVYAGHSRFTSEANRAAGVSTRLEQTNATNAVIATKGRYVVYEGKVATAYFSSSNGPYTARNEDVRGSSPIGYLRGVKDPYYPSSQNWTRTMTGLEVASQLASKSRGVTGAGKTVWVTDVVPTYVNNGWVRSATIEWSSGQTTTINYSDAVRTAFGFRSGYFTVENSANPAPISYAKYEDGSSAFSLVGAWKYNKIAGNSGGAIRTTNTKGSYFEIKFKGEGARWIGPKASSYGRAKVYVNGDYKKTVNLYRSSTARQQTLYEIKGLDPAKTHTLKVVITTKSSGGYGYIGLDRVDVINGKAVYPAFKTYQESSSYIKRTGTWKKSTSAANYGGQAYYTRSLNGTATIRFKGNMVEWTGYKTTDGGRAKVYINGEYQKTVSMKSSSTQRKVVLYTKYALDPTKTHTLKIVNIKAANSSKAGKMTIDQIRVRNGKAVK